MPDGIARELIRTAIDRGKRHPVVTITGPRQSGKTTLCRQAFPRLAYANLEDPTTRERAKADPRAFLDTFTKGAILDEVQRAPELISALQVVVDERRDHGRWVLSGSHNFQLHDAISQSLAGRTSVLELLPFTYGELRRLPGTPSKLDAVLLAGGYPRIHDRRLPPAEFHADYVRTYVERDVRLVLNIQDLAAFQTFLRLCAGRTGQLLNLSSLANDCGITHPTAKAWISVLEASYLVKRLPPWHRNLGKRLVKAPKLHLFDSGLLCWLLGIRTTDQLASHPLRGHVFESWVVAEVLKARWNRGIPDPIWFYADRAGEVDLVLERGDRTQLVEIKSGARVPNDADAALDRLGALLPNDRTLPGKHTRVLIHGGDIRERRRGVQLLPWSAVHDFDWT